MLCYSTGRSLAQFEALREELPRGALLAPDALVTGVGTRVYAPDGFTGGFAEDEDWAQRLRVSWDGAHAADALDAVLGGSRGGVADEVRAGTHAHALSYAHARAHMRVLRRTR